MKPRLNDRVNEAPEDTERDPHEEDSDRPAERDFADAVPVGSRDARHGRTCDKAGDTHRDPSAHASDDRSGNDAGERCETNVTPEIH